MNDSDFIQEIARKWVELGGDSEGVKYSWKRLQEAVINIEYAQQSVQPDDCLLGGKHEWRTLSNGEYTKVVCGKCGNRR